LGETTSAFWTDTELNDYINLAGHDIADKTKCIRDNGYIDTVDGTAQYGLTTNFPTILSIFEVYFLQDGRTWQKLESTSRTRLDLEYPGWMSAGSGTPIQYYENIEEDQITLYVKPNALNAGTDYCRVFYSKDFTDIPDDNSSPTGLGQDLQLAMVDFVMAYGYQQRGWGDKANDSWAKYFNRLKEYMTERGREREDQDIIMKNYRNR
jgi:hypothetical protein